MPKSLLTALSRRERHIMDILFRRGRATADEVMRELSGTPSYSTVRTQLRVLEEKGHVRHEEQGRRFVYIPVVPRSLVRRMNFDGCGLLRSNQRTPSLNDSEYVPTDKSPTISLTRPGRLRTW